jgi:hypothetical protein
VGWGKEGLQAAVISFLHLAGRTGEFTDRICIPHQDKGDLDIDTKLRCFSKAA